MEREVNILLPISDSHISVPARVCDNSSKCSVYVAPREECRESRRVIGSVFTKESIKTLVSLIVQGVLCVRQKFITIHPPPSLSHSHKIQLETLRGGGLHENASVTTTYTMNTNYSWSPKCHLPSSHLSVHLVPASASESVVISYTFHSRFLFFSSPH